jgi:hypothetical protein
MWTNPLFISPARKLSHRVKVAPPPETNWLEVTPASVNQSDFPMTSWKKGWLIPWRVMLHDCQRRPPRLDLTYQYVTDLFGQPTADLLFIECRPRVLDGS